MRMKDNHLYIIIFVALFVLVGNLCLIYQINLDGECSTENTLEFSAVIDDIQQETVRDCILCSPENHNVLILNFNDVKEITGLDTSRILKNGDIIFFRVHKKWLPQGAQAQHLLLIQIVSLRTETQEIMTLDAYNAWERPARNTTLYAMVALCTILTIAVVACTIILIRRKRKGGGKMS